MTQTNDSKVIAVMTSGGDAPGMNAAVRGVYGRAKEYGWKVLGIRDGYTGLLNEDFFELEFKDVDGITRKGGTVLGTSRCEEFKELETQKKAAEICRKSGISDIVVIGGDGSYQGARCLYEQGIGVVGIPGTIDLDIASTEYTLGFDTAVNSAMTAIDKIMDSSRSHKCFSVVEVMGRRRGFIALWTGIANSAAEILIPEVDTLDTFVDSLKSKGLRDGLIVVAEGASTAQEVADRVEKELGVHTRVNVLGFLQRGGDPSARDRVTGCEMGAFAVTMISEGKNHHVVGEIRGRMQPVEMTEAFRRKAGISKELCALSKTITARF